MIFYPKLQFMSSIIIGAGSLELASIPVFNINIGQSANVKLRCHQNEYTLFQKVHMAHAYNQQVKR